MTLTTVRDDPERLQALISILCGAAAADDYVAEQEVAIVQDILRKTLALEELPEAAKACLGQFDRKTLDLAGALDRLALESDEQREALLAAAMEVVVADRFIDSGEYGFIAELAELLGLPMPGRLR